MTSCDCCGKQVDERSMATVEENTLWYFVCQACRGMYEDEELIEKCKQFYHES